MDIILILYDIIKQSENNQKTHDDLWVFYDDTMNVTCVTFIVATILLDLDL